MSSSCLRASSHLLLLAASAACTPARLQACIFASACTNAGWFLSAPKKQNQAAYDDVHRFCRICSPCAVVPQQTSLLNAQKAGVWQARHTMQQPSIEDEAREANIASHLSVLAITFSCLTSATMLPESSALCLHFVLSSPSAAACKHQNSPRGDKHAAAVCNMHFWALQQGNPTLQVEQCTWTCCPG